MANHPSTLTAKTPWTVWKGKQIRHWKISTPKVSDTLLGKSGGPVLIAPGRMKRLGQSGKDAQLWCIWWWTKEPLDESERGEWKSGLKTQLSENYGHGIQSHHFMANRWGNNRNSERLYLGVGGATPKSVQMVTAAMKLKDICSSEEKLWPT